jgi:hypothetical protein
VPHRSSALQGAGSGLALLGGLAGAEIGGDAGGPGVDVVPVAKVAFGQQRLPGGKLAHRLLGQRQGGRVKRSEEHLVVPRRYPRQQVGQVPRLGAVALVPPLLIRA